MVVRHEVVFEQLSKGAKICEHVFVKKSSMLCIHGAPRSEINSSNKVNEVVQEAAIVD